MNDKVFMNPPSIKLLNKISHVHTDDKSIEKVKMPSMKLSEVYKNIYSTKVGAAIKNLKSSNPCRAYEGRFIKIEPTRNVLPKISKRFKSFDLNKISFDNCVTLNDDNTVKLGKVTEKSLILEDNQILKTVDDRNEKNNIHINFPTSIQNSSNSNSLSINYYNGEKSINNHKRDNPFYCPFCDHCNNLKDSRLEDNIRVMYESKSFINKAFEFTLKTNILENNNLDLFNLNDKITDNIDCQNVNEKEKKQNFFDIDVLINKFPKIKYDSRLTFMTISHILTALVEDKLNLDSILNNVVSEKFSSSLLSHGTSFENEGNILHYDAEITDLLDEHSRKILENLVKKKYLSLENNIPKDEEKDVSLNKLYIMKKKFLVMYLIFLHLLSDISKECKEKSILLYKFFKLYFAEQEKKWILLLNKVQDKIRYYKDLCKVIIQQKNKHIEKIEFINEVLFSHKITADNLNNHKKLIKDLLNIINEKREEIYILESSIKTYEKELNFWVYDIDIIKVNVELRNKLKSINTQHLIQSITKDLAHKNISKEDKCLLINSDRFLIASGQRTFYSDKNSVLQLEVERLNSLYKSNYFKKKEWKKKFIEKEKDMEKTVNKLEKELENYRKKDYIETVDIIVQTDLQFIDLNKMSLAYENSMTIKKMKTNKLTYYIERIKFNISKNRPVEHEFLLNFIAEVYQEKIDDDTKRELDNKDKLQIDEILYNFLLNRFKLKKIVKNKCESLIIAMIKYSPFDSRVELFSRFLGIGKTKIRKEILDSYIVLLKCNMKHYKAVPTSFFKLMTDSTSSSYQINLDICLDIYYTAFSFFNFQKENFSLLLKECVVFVNNKEIVLKEETKSELYLIRRFFNHSVVFIQESIEHYKKDEKSSIEVELILEKFILVNKEFKLKNTDALKILEKHFKFEGKFLTVESFLNFFDHKYTFLIRVMDFLEISLQTFMNVYYFFENKLNSCFDKFDTLKNESINYNQFKEALISILGGNDRVWKLNDFFL